MCIFCKNWLENDVLVGYRDFELNEVDLDYSILSNSQKFRKKQPDFMLDAINKAYSKFSKVLSNLT